MSEWVDEREAWEQQRDSALGEFSAQLFEGIIGQEFDFYGAAENQFKLGDVVWEAVEDPSDGYRSCLGCIIVKPESQTIFFKTPISRVRVDYFKGMENPNAKYLYERREVDFYKLVDISDGHVWLTLGTDNSDDYYPSFHFNYAPKELK